MNLSLIRLFRVWSRRTDTRRLAGHFVTASDSPKPSCTSTMWLLSPPLPQTTSSLLPTGIHKFLPCSADTLSWKTYRSYLYSRSVVCALQCRISGKAWTEWTLDSASMHNLPVIDGPHLVIHLVDDKPPVMVTCLSSEKLSSLQLAIEYSLLLSLPYNPVANVHFNSLVNQE